MLKKILCLAFILFVYRAIFLNSELIGGDWPYYFKEYLNSFILPQIWNPIWPTGLGGNQAIILPLQLYMHLVVMIFVNTLGVPWQLAQKIFFFWLFLGLAIYSSYQLTKSWIGVLIYTTNTWILMVLSGGQIGIALAYAIAPLVLKKLIEGVKYKTLSIKYIVLSALIFAIHVMLDIRVAFLTTLIVLGYIIFHHFIINRIGLVKLVIHYSLLIILVALLHSFWILPSVFISIRGGNVASIVDTSIASLEFFSFAKFENSLSLLHPNWPENIFGKVAFMKPEFLIIPILAFGSLLFIRNSKFKIKNNTAIEQYKNGTILFFALVGLAGAFLAKGIQEPFGFIFNFLYSNIPGFNLFRDPVKFYIFIALAYSMLIPYTLRSFGKFKNFAFMLFILFWVYLNLPFILEPNVGVFKQRTIPQDYIELKEFLVSKPEFFRTLWIPSVQRFAFVSDNRPAIGREEILKGDYEEQIKQLKKQGTGELLRNLSVKYVIVPYDSEGEIFLSDRKYDEDKYKDAVEKIREITWLKERPDFGKIAVFEVDNPRGRFFSPSASVRVSYQMIKPTEYKVRVENAKEGDILVFAEGFDAEWKARENNVDNEISSTKYYNLINSFRLPKAGSYNLEVYYEPQKWVERGLIVSAVTLLGMIFILYRLKQK
jgi:hypothetical protein